MAEDNIEVAKNVVDAVSVGTVAGSLMGWLPPLAALLTIIWTTIRITETNTVRSIVKKFKK
jgi:TctA family transporter